MSSVSVSLDKAILTRLITQGELCVSQLKALDPQSKQTLWQLCLDCSCQQTSSNTTTQVEPLRFRSYLPSRSGLGTDS